MHTYPHKLNISNKEVLCFYSKYKWFFYFICGHYMSIIWTKVSVQDLEHHTEKIVNHEHYKSHVDSILTFTILECNKLNKGYIMSITRWNKHNLFKFIFCFNELKF